MHLDAYNETGIAQQSILQLPQANHFGIPVVACPSTRLAITLVKHHLLAIVGPPFGIGVCSQNLAYGAWRLWHPQELYVVSWISLVNRSADNGSPVEGGHALFDLPGCIVWSGQGDVEVGLGSDFLKRAGGIHGG